jgi:hypothetical protein
MTPTPHITLAVLGGCVVKGFEPGWFGFGDGSLTTAGPRRATRRLSCSSNSLGGRVMPGVRRYT